VGGRSAAALRRAAWLGDGYLGYFLDAPGVQTRLGRLRELRAEAPDEERRGIPLTMAMQTFVRMEDDRERALASVSARLGAMYGAETQRAAGRFAIVGNKEDCRRRLAELADAGVEHLICSPVVVSADLEDQLERLAENLS
jgi:alkanesulfonate monooxygenase SsuD/methylene tetrahydromethanopterin reductase-like flavin-dependent oxidoreductase (luciferase family)